MTSQSRCCTEDSGCERSVGLRCDSEESFCFSTSSLGLGVRRTEGGGVLTENGSTQRTDCGCIEAVPTNSPDSKVVPERIVVDGVRLYVLDG